MMIMNKHFKCPECGLLTEDGLTSVTYELEGTQVTIKDVPAQVCPNGHSYLDGYTAESVNRLVNHVVEDVNAYSKKLARPSAAVREVVIAA
jgi:YgiT-type zinc finger domain-containing protein